MCKLKLTMILGLALLALSACGGNGPAPAGPGLEIPVAATPGPLPDGGSLALPAPGELDRLSSEVDEYSRYVPGSSFEASLPHNLVDSSMYSPLWSSPADGLGKAAYACYRFGGLSEYEGSAQLHTDWYTDVPDNASQFLALANFQTNRWDWFSYGADGAQPGMAGPYLSETGSVYCCLLLLGTKSGGLKYIVLGDNLTPIVYIITDLDTDKFQNIAPRTVAIDASATEDFGSAIDGFDFDFDGDGFWDETGNPDGHTQHTYNAGNYTLRVRANETSGRQGLKERSFAIIDPNNQPPFAKITADLLSGSAPLHVGFDALASSDADGYITRYEYDFDDDGTVDIDTDDPAKVHGELLRFGGNLVTLRVTDNFFAQDTDTVVVNLDHGWQYSVVDSDVGINFQVALCASGTGLDARPSLAYGDYKTHDLRYCQALNEAGTAWGPIRYPLVKPSTATSVSGVSIVYSGLIDAPIISLVTDNSTGGSSLRSVTAMDTQGSAWNPDVSFAGDADPKFYSSIAIINNIPCVAAGAGNAGFGGPGQLIYVRADNASASSWGSEIELPAAEAGSVLRAVSLLPSFNGGNFVPLLSYMAADNVSEQALCLRAIDGNGNSWEAPDLLCSGNIDFTSMYMVDGRPAVMAGSPNQGGELFYTRSGDGKGQTWPGPAIKLPDGGGFGGLTVWGGLPLMAYRDFVQGGIWIVQAADAQGSAWQDPLPVDQRYRYGDEGAVLMLNEKLMLCYEGADDSLICASWK